MHVINLTGQRFGRLEVVERAPRPAYHSDSKAWWLCKCRCGEFITVNGQSLRNGRTKSCGCLRNDRTREHYHNKAKGA